MLDRYSRPELRALWSDQRRYETWLEVELAVCEAMEARELVPRGTSASVRERVRVDAARIVALEERVRHDVIAFLTHVEEQVGEPARWLHLGMTSSDVLDSAFAIQLRTAGEMILEALDALTTVVRRRAMDFKSLPVVGRTHGIHAEPTSLGLVFLGFFAELERQRERLRHAVEQIAVGKVAGAVGVYGNLDPQVERAALATLGLRPEPCATQVVPRDRHAEFFSALALLAATVERMALQVRHWQRTEVGEAGEAFSGGQKGSSAMPHKKNPILSENLCGLARLVRSYAGAALENVALWHERDISHSSVERAIGPDATTIVHFMLHRATGLFDGLDVNVERVERNLQQTGGLIFSEAVLLALVNKGLARQAAYELVQAQAMAAQAGRGEFLDLLIADPGVRAWLTAEEVASCFDLRHHLRHVETIYQRVLEKESAP